MTSKAETHVTILDVLEMFFQGRPSRSQLLSLSRFDIEQLRERVKEFSSAEEALDAPADAVYPGSWLGGNWGVDAVRTELDQLLLYNRVILTHDPVADFFCFDNQWLPELAAIRYENGYELSVGPTSWNAQLTYDYVASDLDRLRGRLAGLVSYVFDLAPLLRAGVLVLRPQWKLWSNRQSQQALLTSMRHDVRDSTMREAAERLEPLPRWDNIKGMRVTMSNPVQRRDERLIFQCEFLELAKQVGFAASWGATYVPQVSNELDFLRAKLGSLNSVQTNHPRAATLEQLAQVTLPRLSLPTETAVEMRLNESAFEDWRSVIRRIDRDGRDDEPLVLAQRVQDELRPIGIEIERTISRSATLETFRQGTLNAVLTLGTVMTAAHLTGSDTRSEVISAAAGGVVGWLYGMFGRRDVSGEATVLSSLQRIPDQGPQT